MSQFLLPCACGAKIPVNRSQAGMSLPCLECGKTVEVPTIRKLAEFASSAPAKKEAKSRAGKWLGPIAAISFIISLLGLAYGGSLAYERYTYISELTQTGANLNLTEAEFIAEVRKSSLLSAPADTWDFWNAMVNNGLSDPNPPGFFQVKRYLASQVPMMRGSFLVGSISLAVFALSTFLMQKFSQEKLMFNRSKR